MLCPKWPCCNATDVLIQALLFIHSSQAGELRGQKDKGDGPPIPQWCSGTMQGFSLPASAVESSQEVNGRNGQQTRMKASWYFDFLTSMQEASVVVREGGGRWRNKAVVGIWRACMRGGWSLWEQRGSRKSPVKASSTKLIKHFEQESLNLCLSTHPYTWVEAGVSPSDQKYLQGIDGVLLLLLQPVEIKLTLCMKLSALGLP